MNNQNQDTELWLPCPNYEGVYEVSNFGQVRRCDGHHHSTGKPLVQLQGSHGYMTVHLSLSKAERCYVHLLVLRAFKRECPCGLQGAHQDGNRRNNFASNLEWMPPKENTLQKKLHGTHQAGEKHGRHRLTEADVLEIDQLRDGGMSFMDIGRLYGLYRDSAVRHAYFRITWKHLAKAA